MSKRRRGDNRCRLAHSLRHWRLKRLLWDDYVLSLYPKFALPTDRIIHLIHQYPHGSVPLGWQVGECWVAPWLSPEGIGGAWGEVAVAQWSDALWTHLSLRRMGEGHQASACMLVPNRRPTPRYWRVGVMDSPMIEMEWNWEYLHVARSTR